MRLLDVNISAQFQLNSWLGLELVAPYRLVETDASFLDTNGKPLPDSAGDIHHRDEIIQGLADPQVISTFQIPHLAEEYNTHLSLKAGISIPTAPTQPNPFALGDAGIKHQHIFFGTGTVNPIVGFSFRTAFSNFDITGWSYARAALQENERGYQGPSIYSGALGIKTDFGLTDLSFILQQEFQKETPAKWRQINGKVMNARNSGRTDLFATTGIFWKTSPKLSLYALLKIPYWTQSQGGQMDIPAFGSIGLQWENPIEFRTSQASTEAQGHVHPPHTPVHSGGDIKDLAVSGESFELVDALVPNKITIIDFWAQWCEPCHVIDDLLREIVENHSNVAVRRVEVPTFDTPVYHQHLSQIIGLPVVWIFSPEGKLIEKLEGVAPEKVKEKVNEVLKNAASLRFDEPEN